MRGLALMALALTLGYSQCVAMCTLDTRHAQPAQTSGHCHQHPDPGNPAPSNDTCAHNSAAELPGTVVAAFPVAEPVAFGFVAPQIRPVFADLLTEALASPPGSASPIAPLRI